MGKRGRGRPPQPEAERFWSKVDVRGEDECWPWLAGKSKGGYGRFRRYRPYEMISASKMAFILTHGREPEIILRHRCNNPPCCNPRHLTEGSYQENTDDMKRANRSAWKLTPEDVEEIRASNEPSRVIAPKYGVTDGYVRHLRRRVRRIVGPENR